MDEGPAQCGRLLSSSGVPNVMGEGRRGEERLEWGSSLR